MAMFNAICITVSAATVVLLFVLTKPWRDDSIPNVVGTAVMGFGMFYAVAAAALIVASVAFPESVGFPLGVVHRVEPCRCGCPGLCYHLPPK